jgi:hypothetical protein
MRNTPAASVAIGKSGFAASTCIRNLYQIRMLRPTADAAGEGKRASQYTRPHRGAAQPVAVLAGEPFRLPGGAYRTKT